MFHKRPAPSNTSSATKDAMKSPSQRIPNFVSQCTSVLSINRNSHSPSPVATPIPIVLDLSLHCPGPLSDLLSSCTQSLFSLSPLLLSVPITIPKDYEASTFHHLSSWRLQYQRLVSQLNRSNGPEFQPWDDDSSSSSSSSNSSHLNKKALLSTVLEEDTQGGGLDGSMFSTDSDSHCLPPPHLGHPSLALQPPSTSPNIDSSSNQIILHLDMDAFYANVLIERRFPSLRAEPVIVVPTKNTHYNGTSEVSSANYVARSFGIRARMFMSEARKLCPKVHILACDFPLFEDASARMYQQILRYTHIVEAVSADEAYLDISPWGWAGASDLAARIQRDVFRATSCPCSLGIGPNKLIARLSTYRAKPAGIVLTTPQEAPHFVTTFSIDHLPGVGLGTASKLAQRGIHSIEQLIAMQKQTLQSWFGEKTGESLFLYARAIDPRPLKTEQDRKSVGTQISWGVRMGTEEQVKAFLGDLCAEVSKRLSEISMVGSRVTLRVLKKRQAVEADDAAADKMVKSVVVDARMGGCSQESESLVPKGESAKVFNPGECIQMSKSGKLSIASADAKAIGREILRLYKTFGMAPTDLRGAGISMDDLQPTSSQTKHSTIHSFFKSKSKEKQESEEEDSSMVGMPVEANHDDENGEQQDSTGTTRKRQLHEVITQEEQLEVEAHLRRKPPPPPPPPQSSSSSSPSYSVHAPGLASRSPKKQPTITSMFSRQIDPNK